MKRALLAAGVVVLLLVAGLGAGVAEMFAGLRPIADGYEVNGVRVVADGFTALAVASSGDGGVVLFDAGMDQAGAAILAELARRGLGPEAVRAVFLTHGHGDHIGALGLFAGAQIVALEAEVPLVEGRATPSSPLGRLMPPADSGLRVTRPVEDGEVVTVGELAVRVFAVPGHTAGSAAYLVNDVLVLGDSAQITRDGGLRPAPWLVTDDRAQNRASLAGLARRLADEGLTVAAVVPAHSGAVEGLGPLAASAGGTE